MGKFYSETKPLDVVTSLNIRVLNYGIYEVDDSELDWLWAEIPSEFKEGEEQPTSIFRDSHKYGYYSVEVPIGQWTRDGIVNAIIRDKYRIDEMEAITNNMAAIVAVFLQTLVNEGIIAATKYLKDSINDENSQKFKEMQEWRKMAKEVAKSIIKD